MATFSRLSAPHSRNREQKGRAYGGSASYLYCVSFLEVRAIYPPPRNQRTFKAYKSGADTARGDACNIGSQLTRLLGDGGRQPGEVNNSFERYLPVVAIDVFGADGAFWRLTH